MDALASVMLRMGGDLPSSPALPFMPLYAEIGDSVE